MMQKAINDLRRDVNAHRDDNKTPVENPWTTYLENPENKP
jgi:hypothetical protein